MSRRRVVVEAAFGKTPFSTIAAGDWVELVDTGGPRVRSARWSFGRPDPLEDFEGGTATVLLRNRDRHLDPDNSSSPHAGNLVPLVPVRLRSQDLDTLAYADEFYGFVWSGWRQVLAPKGACDCEVVLVDWLALMTRTLRDVFEAAVLDQSPDGFWVLSEAKAEMVADLSGNGHAGTVVGEGVTMGDRVIAPGHPPAARFDVEVDASTGKEILGSIDLGRSPIIADVTTGMVMAVVQARDEPAIDTMHAVMQSDGNKAHTGVIMGVAQGGGQLFWHRSVAGSFLAPKTNYSVVDQADRIAFGWAGNLLVDGQTFTTATTGSINLNPTFNGFSISGGRSLNPDTYWDGWIGAVAVWQDHSTVGASGRTAILDAYTLLDGQTSDQHVAWALDEIGVPAGLRNLDTGTVVMGPAQTKGRVALDWMRDVARTEGGGLYIDHRDGGKVRFTNRYARHLDTRSTTSQATFADDAGTIQVRYPAEGFDLAPNGLDGIVNQVTVTWAGGEVTVEDTAATVTRHRTIQTVASTPGQAYSAGEWVVANHKDPATRIRGVTCSARSTFARDDRVQGLRIDDRVTFRVRPGKVGATTEVDLFVDGVSHIAEGTVWETSFRFAPDHTFTPWIWGTGAWGTTAYWG